MPARDLRLGRPMFTRASRGRGALTGGVRRDFIDLRDLPYRPTLRPLPRSFLCSALSVGQGNASQLAIRNQGDSPSCAGEALAALIDMQRIEIEGLKDVQQGVGLAACSGDMLYNMALQGDGAEGADAAQGGVTGLRAALKGFYNCGVCSGSTWIKEVGRSSLDVGAPTVTVMKEARDITLGAYYRVSSFLNDYHSALVEVGALYVSAQLHSGWSKPRDGVIEMIDDDQSPGGHAFVVVGYDERGFYVLNSWGGEWGGLKIGGQTLAGVALWTYEDWAANVFDAWALRLAAPTPEAFIFALDQQGRANFAQPTLAAFDRPRRSIVLGRYVHLDDGVHVARGSYPSSPSMYRKTIAYLRVGDGKARYDTIVLQLHGDPDPTDRVLRRMARSIGADKRNRLYRISLIWANDLISTAARALNSMFAEARQRACQDDLSADRRIELETQPIVRAVWRDVERAARRSAWRDSGASRGSQGAAMETLEELLELGEATGKSIHLVCEGAGAVLFCALVERASTARLNRWAKLLRSLAFVSPFLERDTFAEVSARFATQMQAEGGQAALIAPNASFERDIALGPYYTGSWAQLVASAFRSERKELLRAHMLRRIEPGPFKHIMLHRPDDAGGSLSYADIFDHKETRKALAALTKTQAAQRKEGSAT